MVPGVVLNFFARSSKFCNADYFTILDKEEVNVYNARTTTVTTSKPPVLKWW